MSEQEVIDTPRTELARAVEGLPAKAADDLIGTFGPLYEQAYPLAIQAPAFVVTDPTQLTEMKAAREVRLKLRAIRVETEKVRRATKDEALRTGQAIDKVAGVVKSMCEQAENHLMEQETFAERAEAARRARLARERAELLAPYVDDTAPFDLAGMPQAAFDEFLEGAKARKEKQEREALEARQKAEAERVAREAEAKRIREENARLAREKAEADERLRQEKLKEQAARDIERQKHEAELRKQQAAADAEREKIRAQALREQKAREKAERELAEKKAAEEKAAKAKAAAERRAARAPECDKIRSIGLALAQIPLPKMATTEGTEALERVRQHVRRCKAEIDAIADALA